MLLCCYPCCCRYPHARPCLYSGWLQLFDHLVEVGAYEEKQGAELLEMLGGAVALLHAQVLITRMRTL